MSDLGLSQTQQIPVLLITDAQTSWAGEHFIPYTWDMTTEKFGWMSLDADRKFVYPMCEIGFPHSYTFLHHI